jgi:phage shock protein A
MFSPKMSKEQEATIKVITEGSRILNGWKEVAAFLGRGVRTVQRWEVLGLPVHRPHGRTRSAVVASSDELAAWFAATPQRDMGSIAELQAKVADLEARVDQLKQENATLRLHLALAENRREEIVAERTALKIVKVEPRVAS